VTVRRILHNVQDKADSLLGKSCHQIIIPPLFPVDAMEPGLALSRDEPAWWLIHPLCRSLEAAQATRVGRHLKSDEVFVLHEVRGVAVKMSTGVTRVKTVSSRIRTGLFPEVGAFAFFALSRSRARSQKKRAKARRRKKSMKA
jgi:hypothetical protein